MRPYGRGESDRYASLALCRTFAAPFPYGGGFAHLVFDFRWAVVGKDMRAQVPT